MPSEDLAAERRWRIGSAIGKSTPLKKIDIHVSHLFLRREHADKLKQAVKLPLLDSSPIDARRSTCEGAGGERLLRVPASSKSGPDLTGNPGTHIVGRIAKRPGLGRRDATLDETAKAGIPGPSQISRLSASTIVTHRSSDVSDVTAAIARA